MADDVTTAAPETPAHWHALSVDEVRARLQVPDAGLGDDEVRTRLERFGHNALATATRTPWYLTLLQQFRSPMVLFLLAAAVVTALLQEWFDAAVILFALVINAAIGFWQTRKAESDVQALQSLTSPEATVLRNGGFTRLDAAELVPGDIVRLESGDRVPADLRMIDLHGLQIDESMLTGEVLPTSKNTSEADLEASIGDRRSMGFSGTLVVSGRATGIVVGTGAHTELGAIAELVQNEGSKTPLQILTDRLERFLGAAVLLIAVMIFVASIVLGNPVAETFRTTVALIVSAMPEALPIVLSVAMGVGVSRMAKHHAVVRNLPSVETLGSADIIGSDKTGTLTVNRLTVEQLWTPDHHCLTVPAGGVLNPDTHLSPAQRLALRTGALTNDATSAPEDPTVLRGDAVDVAMAAVALRSGAVTEDERAQAPLADMPYEPELAYSQRVHREGDRLVLHAKGAPETILSFCTAMLDHDGQVPVQTEEIHRAVAAMAEQGLRVIATAHRVLTEIPETGESRELPAPAGLVFTGLQGMMDPPRPGVPEAIEQCRNAGIQVLMITGDHPTTAEAIGRRLGLDGELPPLTGADMDRLGDHELLERLEKTAIAARMSPQDKLRIVKTLQRDQHTVAITGDGVNDAPALKAASIGVAMGASGTDVARESADVVLTDDNFVTIVDAIEQGRITFSSIRKATFFLISNGLAALIAVAVNTFTDLPLIFLPAMLIFMNVVTNGIQDIALAFEKGEGDELAQRPRDAHEGVLNRTMLLRSLITGTWMGVGALIVYRLAHDAGLELDHARTLALITMVMFNFFQVFSARAERKSLFALNPFGNPLLIISAFAALALQWGAMTWPVSAALIGLTPLSALEWLACTLIGSTVLVIVEAEKLVRRWHAKRVERHRLADAEAPQATR